ncbi:putative large ATP-binding protein [Streptomyces sp. W007]|nr:NACHT domain-containing protein [Streptomyces anulatus]EHM25544.1 putative large ATP-binding protein [Streptomyces sp. W007]
MSPSVAHPVVHPADRTVVVTAIQQGSGVLLTDRLVLTCAHVVKSGSVQIAHPAVSDRVRATVAWIDYRLDVALLEAVEPVRPVPPVRLGVVDTRQAIPECEITGFPRVQRYGPDRRLEADQYTATVLPVAGRVRDLLVCDLDGPPAVGPDDEPAALSGLSGGPVFMGDVLLGVARQVPRQRDGRRVECVPLAPVLAANPFRLVYRRSGVDLRQERVHGSFPRDLRYEAEYAQALGVAYRRTKIFGLDELNRHDREWDLDTAYLSLEAQAQDRAAPGPPLPRRIDDLHADRPRVLLRGDAGAGKTTLLWWLAAHASARTLGDALAPLNGLVPFMVPLRTLRARGMTFPGPAELSGAAGLVVDTAPEGWAGRVLESGRALLLVDGLDEVPPEEREQAHTWLSQLLARYPETRCVVTVRPLAVEADWLRSEHFAELRLLPMRNEDIQAFVGSWHRAARLSEQDDHERLDELERDLSRQFDQNPTLRDLARTPLLCAVICALHRLRDGLLPETRWKLYRSALDMLLGHRDRRRRIGGARGHRAGGGGTHPAAPAHRSVASPRGPVGVHPRTGAASTRPGPGGDGPGERTGSAGEDPDPSAQPEWPAPRTQGRHLPVHSPNFPGLPGSQGADRGRPCERTTASRGRGGLAGRDPAGGGPLRAARTGGAGRGVTEGGTEVRGGDDQPSRPPCPGCPVRTACGMAGERGARAGPGQYCGTVPTRRPRTAERTSTTGAGCPEVSPAAGQCTDRRPDRRAGRASARPGRGRVGHPHGAGVGTRPQRPGPPDAGQLGQFPSRGVRRRGTEPLLPGRRAGHRHQGETAQSLAPLVIRRATRHRRRLFRGRCASGSARKSPGVATHLRESLPRRPHRLGEQLQGKPPTSVPPRVPQGAGPPSAHGPGSPQVSAARYRTAVTG